MSNIETCLYRYMVPIKIRNKKGEILLLQRLGKLSASSPINFLHLPLTGSGSGNLNLLSIYWSDMVQLSVNTSFHKHGWFNSILSYCCSLWDILMVAFAIMIVLFLALMEKKTSVYVYVDHQVSWMAWSLRWPTVSGRALCCLSTWWQMTWHRSMAWSSYRTSLEWDPNYSASSWTKSCRNFRKPGL